MVSSQAPPRTLLHSLAATVSTCYPATEGFLDELSFAVKAARLRDINDLHAVLASLRESQTALEDELALYESATDLDPRDEFLKKMSPFALTSRKRLDTLTNDLALARSDVAKVVAFYGKDDTPAPAALTAPVSQPLFVMFKLFVDSYKTAKADNARVKVNEQASEHPSTPTPAPRVPARRLQMPDGGGRR
ncbi:hypothetical protein RQP46_010071 [Phenoliferia psychrophenolica]